jgi:hypothetical protein
MLVAITTADNFLNVSRRQSACITNTINHFQQSDKRLYRRNSIMFRKVKKVNNIMNQANNSPHYLSSRKKYECYKKSETYTII